MTGTVYSCGSHFVVDEYSNMYRLARSCNAPITLLFRQVLLSASTSFDIGVPMESCSCWLKSVETEFSVFALHAPDSDDRSSLHATAYHEIRFNHGVDVHGKHGTSLAQPMLPLRCSGRCPMSIKLLQLPHDLTCQPFLFGAS